MQASINRGFRNFSAVVVALFLLCAVSLEVAKGPAKLRACLLADIESFVTIDDIDEFFDVQPGPSSGNRNLHPSDSGLRYAFSTHTRCVERCPKFDKPSRAPPV